MVPVSFTWMQLGAFSSRAKASCFSSPAAPIEFDAEADGGETCRIVELVIDHPSVGDAILRPRKAVRQDGHEGIGEEVTDAGFLQRRDRGAGRSRVR